MTEKAETTVTINPLFPESPNVRLDSFIGEPNPDSPKTLFSICIPAKHQAKELSIVRMQNCDLMHILQNAKMDYRDLTKFTISTTAGPCMVKLHFLIFPNKDNEIQVDYTYSIPQEFGNLEEHEFERCKRVDKEVGQRIHDTASLRHTVSDFATIVHDLICGFADQVYFESLASGTMPDYLITTPPHPQNLNDLP